MTAFNNNVVIYDVKDDPDWYIGPYWFPITLRLSYEQAEQTKGFMYRLGPEHDVSMRIHSFTFPNGTDLLVMSTGMPENLSRFWLEVKETLAKDGVEFVRDDEWRLRTSVTMVQE